MYGKLTAKQRLFIDNYLISLNATESAKLAGYSPRTAHAIGIENLKKPLIKKSIEEAVQERSRKLELKAEDVVQNIMRISAKAEDKEAFGPALKGQELLGRHLGLFDGREQDQEDALKKLDEVLSKFEGVI